MSPWFPWLAFSNAYAMVGTAMAALFLIFGLYLSVTSARRERREQHEDDAANPKSNVIDMQIVHPKESGRGIEHRKVRVDKPDR